MERFGAVYEDFQQARLGCDEAAQKSWNENAHTSEQGVSTIADTGITYRQSANWQKIAAMQDEQVSGKNLCAD